MIYCTSCGTENVDDAQFCYKCGAVQVPAVSPPSWPQGSQSYNTPPTTAYPYAQNYPQAGYPPYGAPPVYNPAQPPYAANQNVVNVGYMPPPHQSGPMSLTGMIMGIVSICFFAVGLIPCLGWVNWFNLIIGGLANIFSWIGLASEGKDPASRGRAITGLILSFIAIFIGMIRLVIGRGIF